MMATDVKKCVSLTFATKLEIVRRVEKREKKSSVTKAYNIPQCTLRQKQTKSDVKSKAEQSKHFGTCRVQTVAFENVERSLHKRFMDARARSMTRSMLQVKAKDLAYIHQAENFAASSGWQQYFKAPYNNAGKKVSRESENANMEGIKKWLEQEWPEVPAKYEPKQIFKADETGLFWQMLLQQTLCASREKGCGGKQNKGRILVLLAANMNGSTKCGPLTSASFGTLATAAMFLQRTRGTRSHG